jgi:hypothetical protein
MELRNVHVSYGNKVPGTHGDLWPITWADDDEMYAAVSDTLGCPEGLYKRGRNVAVARVTGSPGSPSIHILNPMEQFGEALSYEGEGEDRGSWKGSGLTCVEGKLYLAAFHHRYAFEMKRYPWYSATNSRLLCSEDHGASWTHFSEFPAFPSPFGNPSFVQFGKNNEQADDEYVYAVSAAEGRWENNDSVILGRARRDRILSTGSWTYFAGVDSGVPAWGEIGAAARIVKADGRIGSGPEVVWHPESDSFLMATSSYPDLTAGLRSFEDSITACHTRSEFTILQASVLWGPWRVVYQGPGTGTVDYVPRLPCKWLGGKKGQAVIVSAGNFERRNRLEDHYGFVVGKLEWELA